MSEYPIPKFHFQVDWNGVSLSFTEVTGLDIQQEIIEYRHGDSKDFSKIKMAGMRKFSNITLKRGTFIGKLEFYQWMSDIQAERVGNRRDVVIKLLNEKHDPVIAWRAVRCFPVKVQASDLKSDGNEVAIETIELAHEGFSLMV